MQAKMSPYVLVEAFIEPRGSIQACTLTAAAVDFTTLAYNQRRTPCRIKIVTGGSIDAAVEDTMRRPSISVQNSASCQHILPISALG